MGAPQVNWAIYKSLPPAEAQYQLDHVNQSQVSNIVSSHIACLTIAVVAIILRFISRRMSKTPIKADDWMIVAALVFTVGYVTSVLLCMRELLPLNEPMRANEFQGILKYGGGRHAILLKDPIKFAQVCDLTLSSVLIQIAPSNCLHFFLHRAYWQQKFSTPQPSHQSNSAPSSYTRASSPAADSAFSSTPSVSSS